VRSFWRPITSAVRVSHVHLLTRIADAHPHHIQPISSRCDPPMAGHHLADRHARQTFTGALFVEQGLQAVQAWLAVVFEPSVRALALAGRENAGAAPASRV
jgi:hypothetical protein